MSLEVALTIRIAVFDELNRHLSGHTPFECAKVANDELGATVFANFL